MPVEIKITGEDAKQALVELSNLAGGLSGDGAFRPAADEPVAPARRGRPPKAAQNEAVHAQPGGAGEAQAGAQASSPGQGVGANAEAGGAARRAEGSGAGEAGTGEAGGASAKVLDGNVGVADTTISQRIAAAEAESSGAVTEQMLKDAITEFLTVKKSAAKAQEILRTATGHAAITFMKNDADPAALFKKAYDAIKAELGANG